jgi:hypothetical protein
MPAEANRLARPVGRRDRRFIAAVTAAGVLACGIGGAYAATQHSTASSGCIAVPAAGVMGGGDWHYCGSNALRYCRTHTVTACDSVVAAKP